MTSSNKKVFVGFLIILGLLTGCSVHRVLLQRGWIGGEYENAVSPFFKMPPSLAEGDRVNFLPDKIKEIQSGAVLVTRITDNTPVSDAGVKEGDLIFKLNNKKIKGISAFRKAVDSVVPGQTIRLSLYRNGEIFEKTIVVGKESFKKFKYFYIGFRLGPDINIIPNPNFSIFSIVSFKVNKDRPLLSAPSNKYRLENSSEGSSLNNPKWDLWLGIFGFGGSERILNQEEVNIKKL